MRHPYAPFGPYAAAALTGPDPIRTLIGAGLVALSYLIVPDVIAVMLLPDPALGGFMTGTTPAGVLAQLAGFAVPVLVLSMVLRQLHGRRIETLIGPMRPALRQFVAVGLAVFAVSAAQELLPPWPGAADIAEVRPIGPWLAILPLGLAMILLQTSAEEFFFRGYLQQQLAVLSSRPVVWMGLPALFFGVVHYWNGNTPLEGALWGVWAGLLGLACADLTGRSGTLGPAIGLHFANNIFAFLLWGQQNGPNSGLALLLYPDLPGMTAGGEGQAVWSFWTLYDATSLVLGVGVMWLAARIALRR